MFVIDGKKQLKFVPFTLHQKYSHSMPQCMLDVTVMCTYTDTHAHNTDSLLQISDEIFETGLKMHN